MNIIRRHKKASIITVAAVAVFLIFSAVFWGSSITHAQNNAETGRLMTIHDRGQQKIILSHSDTVRGSLKEAGIHIDEKDAVEPSPDEKLVASNYQVNIYRARPVLVVDGKIREKVMTAHQTPEQIVSSAKITLYPEDDADIDIVDDLSYGVGLRLTIKRATPFWFTLYGKTSLVRTQGKTVQEMLREKNITLSPKDRITPSIDTKLTNGLKVKLWREGKQTVTAEEAVDFEISQIQDADREVGYRQIVTPGRAGLRSVTYEILVKDGKEVSRKEIASLVLKRPRKQVEIVGAKPSFSGDFAAALAKLRACESGGNYANKNNPLYRGAYQYSYDTWANKYGIYDPANASPAQQDQAARETYLRRGWQPWPVCGANLPDIYR